jgi:hypothetical protein
LLIVAAVVCWEPLLLNARIGQTGAIVAALTAAAFFVFLRNRNRGALLMGLLSFKPTAAVAPIFMVFPERLPVWVRFYGVVFLIAILPFVWLGPDAFLGWADILTDRAVIDLSGGHNYNQGLSAILNLKNPVGVAIVAAAFLLLALLVNAVESRVGIAVAGALTVLLALLLNPHSLVYDWGAAFAVILLLRKSDMFPERYADVCVGLLALALFGAGQIEWQQYSTGQSPSHLLTIWSLLMTAFVVAIALSPRVRTAVATFDTLQWQSTRQDRPRPAVAPPPVSRRSSRAARRKNRA